MSPRTNSCPSGTGPIVQSQGPDSAEPGCVAHSGIEASQLPRSVARYDSSSGFWLTETLPAESQQVIVSPGVPITRWTACPSPSPPGSHRPGFVKTTTSPVTGPPEPTSVAIILSPDIIVGSIDSDESVPLNVTGRPLAPDSPTPPMHPDKRTHSPAAMKGTGARMCRSLRAMSAANSQLPPLSDAPDSAATRAALPVNERTESADQCPYSSRILRPRSRSSAAPPGPHTHGWAPHP